MQRPLKPRVLGDISRRENGRKRIDVFGSLPTRIDLTEQKVFRIPATTFLKYLIIAGAAAFLVFGSTTAPTTAILTRAVGDTTNTSANTTSGSTVVAAGGSASSSDIAVEQASLQAQLDQLNQQIDQYQG